MGLDMYAFSLDRSSAFNKPRDVLNYRAPATGKDLPSFVIHGPWGLVGAEEFDLPLLDTAWPGGIYDTGAAFLDSRFVLPGSTLLHRWRKHPDLHGWMERRWKSMQWHKGGRKKFDCDARVPLDAQALDALEHAVRNRLLPKTDGFYFGESEGTEQADDLAFIAEARQELAAGKFVYYTSWF